MIKVLHIITGLSTGGAEQMLLKLLCHTDRARFSPSVVSLMDKGDIGDRIEALGIPVHTLEMPRGVPSPRGLMRLVRLLRRERPHLIQAWMYHGNLAAQLGAALARLRVPIVWNVRGTHTNLKVEPPLTALVIWLGARLSSLPTYVVNNSRNSARAHEGALGYQSEKWRILPNGFDTDVFVPSEGARARLRAELGLRPDALIISMVGRYHPVKDHRGFLRAASLLLQRYPDVHFVLVGQGLDADNAELAAHLQDERLRRAVHLLGPRDHVEDLTAAADIATSASLSEGFSNTIGEAMSCGVPCVATDVGDSAWIIGDTGRVVPPGRPDALAHAWSELLDLGAPGRRRLGAMARQRVIDEFSLSAVVRQYQALYEEVLSSLRSRR